MKRNFARGQLTSKNARKSEASDLEPSKALDGFLVSRRSSDCTFKTISFYENRLRILLKFLEGKGIDRIGDMDDFACESFMAYLNSSKTWNEGGKHAVFRTVKTFLGWVEGHSSNYQSPMWGFTAPRLEIVPIPGLEMEELEKMLAACDGVCKKRDYAMLLFLADTGVRAQELMDLNIQDVDLITGDVKIEKGKWRKSRTVIIGSKTKRALRVYLDKRQDGPLFTTDKGFQLTYCGLRRIIERKSSKAGIACPGLHDFRRLFAVTMHRNGVDDITLARFMGHTSTEVLKRYLAENEEDLRKAHRYGSPIDNSMR
jgi:integrase/recombinase XerD